MKMKRFKHFEEKVPAQIQAFVPNVRFLKKKTAQSPFLYRDDSAKLE